MSERRGITLTGIAGSSPLGALASFGLLRVCQQMPGFDDVRMAWVEKDDWQPLLEVPPSITPDSLISALAENFNKIGHMHIDWSDDIRVKPEDFRARLITHGKAADLKERALADFFTSFGSEMAIDGSKGLVKPTALYMTSGQQKFLKIVKEHTENIARNPEQKFRSALFGPWQYEDSIHSLGWDPDAERLYALRHRAPTAEKPQSVSAAIWLATQAMPLFPTVVQGKKLKTAGFFKRKEEGVGFCWPVWSPMIGMDTLRSLIGLAALADVSDYPLLAARGVRAVFRSFRYEFGQGYAVFRPGSPMFTCE